MSSGRRRIQLRPSRLQRVLGRLGFARLLRGAAVHDVGQVARPAVDYRLQNRAAQRIVRSFIEGIEHYQLHTRRCVHVVSEFRLPTDFGMEQRIPEWLAARVRFAAVRGAGEVDYVPIMAVVLTWDETCTEMFLHLDRKVAPGTRAFIAAYLGDAEDSAAAELRTGDLGKSGGGLGR